MRWLMKPNKDLPPILTVQPNHIMMIFERLCGTEDIFKYTQTGKLFHNMDVFTEFSNIT